jgi:hypothetical protein
LAEKAKLNLASALEIRGPESLVRCRRRRNLITFRWLVLLLFVVGYASTYEAFQMYASEYLVLTLVSLAACALLLSRLDRPVFVSFPSWILLGIFCIGYFFQFYWLTLDPRLFPLDPLLAYSASAPDVLLEAYMSICLAFVAFCSIGWWALGLVQSQPSCSPGKIDANSLKPRHAALMSSSLLFAAVALELFTGYVAWRENIGVTGAPLAQLPYRLGGFVWYTRTWLLPTFFLTVVWLGDRFNLRRRRLAGMTLLIAHAVEEALMTGSRGTLVLHALLPLGLLLLLTRKLTAMRCAAIGTGFAAALVAYPVFSVYRSVRQGLGFSVVEPLSQSFAMTFGTVGIVESLLEALRGLVFRCTGMNSLLVMVGKGLRGLGLGVAGQVTPLFDYAAYRIPTSAHTANAPSLVGWFYFVGGNAGVVLGIAGFALVVQWLWRTLNVSSWRCKVVAQAMFLVLLTGVATDGVLESVYLPILTCFVPLLLVELLLVPPGRRPSWAPAVKGSEDSRSRRPGRIFRAACSS